MPALTFAASLFALALVPGVPALAAQGDCSQPVSSGTTPNTSDCSFVLRAAVGTKTCALCVCDVNSSSSLTTVDALICLKKAVGQSVTIDCVPCGPTTTTPSTTSTSTTSTTTTIPVRCDSNSDCGALPDTFRCNPNTDTCEKPCTKTADCKDFYECNTTTGYCQQPALLY